MVSHPSTRHSDLAAPTGAAHDSPNREEAAVTERTTYPRHTAGFERFRIGRPRLRGAFAYLSLSVPIGLVSSLPLLLLTVAGVVSSVIWVGLPILIAVTAAWRGVARMERGWMRVTLGVDIPSPYRPLPAGSQLRRWRAKLADPATWRDISYVLLRVPLCVIEFLLVVALWVYSIAVLLLPIYGPLLPLADAINVPNLRGQMVAVHTVSQSLPYAGIGLVLLVVAVLVTPWVVRFQATVAKALLGPTAAARLAVRAEHLQASRARGVDAAEAERRRIERDLHDGAQQRLVAVAMTLGRAKNKLDNDPESARALIDEAHADAKQAVAELRDLARGIYPAVLGDRGLDAALSALAARSPVPVAVDVDVSPRPPAAVESAAYFIVAESLTNLAKHSAADSAQVSVLRRGNSVTVRVTDDGHGGADVRPGGGLAGLADRAATIDGVMTVRSPPGGPTVVTAELPCEW
jgi:signal transduction histidine kinase